GNLQPGRHLPPSHRRKQQPQPRVAERRLSWLERGGGARRADVRLCVDGGDAAMPGSSSGRCRRGAGRLSIWGATPDSPALHHVTSHAELVHSGLWSLSRLPWYDVRKTQQKAPAAWGARRLPGLLAVTS